MNFRGRCVPAGFYTTVHPTTGLSVLKCQATDKPKALILRRGPHRDGGPWTLSRLIQLCYNPLPTRASSAPRRPLLLSSDTLGHRSPASRCRGLRKPNTRLFRIPFTTASIPQRTAIFLARALNYYDRFAARQNIYARFSRRISCEIIDTSAGGNIFRTVKLLQFFEKNKNTREFRMKILSVCVACCAFCTL